MTTPATPLRHYEDVVVGATIPFGRLIVTREEIVAFATAFDPQPFHLDEAAAKASLIGRLCASGWHSCAMLMRMLADDVLAATASLGSPGVAEVKWLQPVFPGDVLSGRTTCRAKRLLRSRPGVGMCRNLIELVKADGSLAMSWDTQQLVRVREPCAADAVPGPAETPGDSARAMAASTPEAGAGGPSNYFEDLAVGETVDLGSHAFTRAEIVDFARKYDPQPFHLDEAAAAASLFGALSASGWHTAAVWLRHQLDHRKRIADAIAFRGETPARYGPSPGFESLSWTKPVLAGDTIRYSARIREKVPSRSRPAVGLVLTDCEGVNQRGERVFAVTTKVFVERRAAAA